MPNLSICRVSHRQGNRNQLAAITRRENKGQRALVSIFYAIADNIYSF